MSSNNAKKNKMIDKQQQAPSPIREVDQNDVYVKQQLEQALLQIRKQKQQAQKQLQETDTQIEQFKKIYQDSLAKQNKKTQYQNEQKIIYQNIRATLEEANINADQILDPQFDSNTETKYRHLSNKQILKIQRIMIQKLTTKLKSYSS